MRDESVNEINLNQDGRIWISKYGQGKFETNIEIFEYENKFSQLLGMIKKLNDSENEEKIENMRKKVEGKAVVESYADFLVKEGK